jgi:hypothetical protein
MEQDCFVDGDWWTKDLAFTSDPQSATAASPERDTSLPIAAHVLEGSRLVGVRLVTPRTYRSSFLRPNTFKKQTPVAACDSPASSISDRIESIAHHATRRLLHGPSTRTCYPRPSPPYKQAHLHRAHPGRLAEEPQEAVVQAVPTHWQPRQQTKHLHRRSACTCTGKANPEWSLCRTTGTVRARGRPTGKWRIASKTCSRTRPASAKPTSFTTTRNPEAVLTVSVQQQQCTVDHIFITKPKNKRGAGGESSGLATRHHSPRQSGIEHSTQQRHAVRPRTSECASSPFR